MKTSLESNIDEVFERVLINRGGEKLVYSIGKYGILWKNDRVSGKFRGFKETVFQNAFTHIDPETGEVTYRKDIQTAQLNEWTSACPSSSIFIRSDKRPKPGCDTISTARNAEAPQREVEWGLV